MDTWDETTLMSFDFETSGTNPEYALQPWRIRTNDFWATSLVWYYQGRDFGGLNPDKAMMTSMLNHAIENKIRIIGWNVVFDISVLLAYGLEELVFKCKWLDAMLLWRHLEVEPEYDAAPRSKKSFGLKTAVAKFLPDEAGYEDGIDFHDESLEERARLHQYNVRDSKFTLFIAGLLWSRLNARQRRVALIESECFPMLAQANLSGFLIDTLVANDLAGKLEARGEAVIDKLRFAGVDEVVVSSPNKLGELLFDHWKLPVISMTKPKSPTGVPRRSTDKATLYELALIDPRVRDLRIYRESKNQRTKFALAPIKAVEYNGDGRAHPLVGAFRTYSGRMSYSSKQTVTRAKSAPEAEEADDG